MWTPERISQGIGAEEAIALVTWLVEEQPPEADGAAALRAWADAGETPAAIAALVRWLQARAVQVPLPTPAMDVCGTGGSGLTRYNVSTTVAFVLATLGVQVAKHGNRGSRRPNGSFDLLDALGIPFELVPDAQVQLFEATNLVFCFARQHHPVVGKVGAYRKAAACRTIFNLSGPLANPAPMEAQLLGTADPARLPVLTEALQELGLKKFVVCHGEPGIDECSISGATQWLAATDGASVQSGGCDLQVVEDYADLPGGDAPVNAALFDAILGGNQDAGVQALREMVVANAALAISCWRGESISAQGEIADECRSALLDGRVAQRATEYRGLARQLKG